MLRIAVCDDEPEYLRKVTEMLEHYFSARPALKGQVVPFGNGETLLESAGAQNGFDLYLLDILMSEMNGIQAGQRLRALGEGGEIIYLTSSNDFAADSYEVGAFFYLLKPVKEQKLFQVLDAAVKKLEHRRNSAIMVPTPDGTRRIMLDRILYVELVNRSIRYHCADGVVDSRTIRAPFREMTAPLLTDPRFCPCGTSFVLNLQHVSGVNGRTALLDNGAAVPLPRTAASAFKSAWGRYWLEEAPSW